MIGDVKDHQSSFTSFFYKIFFDTVQVNPNFSKVWYSVKFGIQYQHQMCQMNFSVVHDVNQSIEELSTDPDIVLKESAKQSDLSASSTQVPFECLKCSSARVP